MDKALAIGVDVNDVEIGLRWNEGGFWYPEKCVINAEYNPALAEYIECNAYIDHRYILRKSP